MSNSNIVTGNSEAIIEKVEVTGDILTGRGGLSLFVRYLRGIGLYPQLEIFFGSIRRSRKGQPISEVFKQLFCFFFDGTSRHLVYFDTLKADDGYGGPRPRRCSRRIRERFFGAFGLGSICYLLQRMFLWRVRLSQPEVVILGLDTMVLG